MTRATLVCVGDEQEAWGRTAFPSPRHYYLMPAPLLLARVLEGEGGDGPPVTATALFLNRKVQDFQAMREAIAATSPRLLGFSCYSWNLHDSLELARALTTGAGDAAPLVMLGGPAVSFGDPAEAAELLRREPAVAAVALGEGEPVIRPLARALLAGSEAAPPGCVVRTRRGVSVGRGPPPTAGIEQIPEIDLSAVSVPRDAETGLAAVVQTYRGCPYSCAYCGFRGGRGGIRRLPLERVERELVRLLAARIEAVHFADSVFDISAERARRILSRCAESNRETSLFCYAAFQQVDEELGGLFERTGIQIGVGLQSVDEGVLARVRRRFDVERFREAAGVYRRTNYYADLMFGLPGDSLAGFARSVDAAMELGPRLLMPFPLTVVARAPLADDPAAYQVVRHEDDRVREEVAPVSGLLYADIGLGRGFDLGDLRRFDDLATAVFFAMQRHPESFRVLERYARATADRGHGMGGFALLEAVGAGIRERLGGRPVSLAAPPALGAAVYELADGLMAAMGAGATERRALSELLRLEGKIALVLERPGRRRRFREAEAFFDAQRMPGDPWPDRAGIGLRMDHVKTRLEFSWEDLLRLPELGERISPAPGDFAALVPFDDWRVRVERLSPAEAALLELLPEGRTARFAAAAQRLGRRFCEAELRAASRRLAELHLIGFVAEG